MELSEGIIDDSIEDWRYWKCLFYELYIKYDMLVAKYKEISSKLSSEAEKSRQDSILVRELNEKIKILSSKPTSQRNYSISSSYGHYKNSSSGCDSYTRLEKTEELSENTKLYEAFLILSGDSEDSKIIYSYSNTDIIQTINTKIINEFIFPTQISNKNIKLNSVSDLFELLYPNFYRDKNSFVFTLKGNSNNYINIPNIPNRNKELLYCCCVVIEDINIKDMKNIQNSFLCYCILTYCPCFELHFEIIYRLLAIKRIERTGKLMESDITSYDLPKLLEILKEKSPCAEEIYMLDTYGVFTIRPSLCVRIDVSDLEPVEYEFSQSLSTIDTT